MNNIAATRKGRMNVLKTFLLRVLAVGLLWLGVMMGLAVDAMGLAS